MKINLIPEIKKEQLRIRKTNLLVTNVAIATAVIFGGVILALTMFIVGMQVKAKAVEKDTAEIKKTLESETYASLEKTVLSIEQGLKDVKQIVTGDDKWESIFAIFEAATPNDIRFKSLDITKDLVVSATLEGKNVNSIDRFLRSFQNYKNKDALVFSAVEVSGYTTDDKGVVSFSAQFKINSAALDSKKEVKAE